MRLTRGTEMNWVPNRWQRAVLWVGATAFAFNALDAINRSDKPEVVDLIGFVVFACVALKGMKG